MATIEEHRERTLQRIKVLKALGYETRMESASERQVKEFLEGIVQVTEEDIGGIAVLPLGYDNRDRFCNLYNVYVMPKEE